MEESNNISSRYDAVAKQAVNFGIDAQRWYTVYDLKCQIALALGADVQDVKDCLSVYDVDYLIYKTYGGELSKLDLMSDYDVLVATIAILDSGVDTSLIDSEFTAEMTLINLLVPMTNEYFYLEPLSDNTQFTINSADGAPILNLEYSLDGKTWQSWDSYNFNPITANTNEKVYLRGQNGEWTTIGEDDYLMSSYLYNTIITLNNEQFNIGGRLSSLFTGTDEESDNSITMSMIFRESACRDASELIVPKNAKLSYAFDGCSSLISAPRTLSDSILHNFQYMSAFSNCSSLTNVPELPATTLTASCYESMFDGCSSLTIAPKLPATTLAVACYASMFGRCSSLTIAPELPATTLVQNCYISMFDGCSSLTIAHKLPATTLAERCYMLMFRQCSSLTIAPELPATTLAVSCYEGMFEYCQSLVEAPQLPATTLVEGCYFCMFSDCSSLTKAPQLPSRTSEYQCYYRMFWRCTSLASFDFGDQSIFTDSTNSLERMFSNCSKLSYIRCLYDDRNGSGPREYTNWTSGVAPQGTFVTNTDKWKRGANGIPNGWDVVIE